MYSGEVIKFPKLDIKKERKKERKYEISGVIIEELVY